MDNRLKDRIAVITGASSGLGKATALRFADCGAKIVCADLKPSSVEEEIIARHGQGTATFVKCDVTKESDIQNMVTEAVNFGSRIDIIVNYAGVAVEAWEKYHNRVRTHDLATEDFDFELSVNTRGVWLCCKYALQQMLKQEPRQPNARGERTRGWIVNAASMLGVTALPNTPAYTPSKFAVVGMTKQMALDYAKDKIHINCLCPGFVKTPMIQTFITDNQDAQSLAAAHPWNALGRPEDIADGALFLCSDDSSWMTGHPLVIDGGFTAR